MDREGTEASDDLQSSERLAVRKLELEIRQLSKPWWQSAVLIIPSVLTVGGLITGYTTGLFDVRNERLRLETVQLGLERSQLQIDIAAFGDEKRRLMDEVQKLEQQRSALQTELRAREPQIRELRARGIVLETEIGRSREELLAAKKDLELTAIDKEVAALRGSGDPKSKAIDRLVSAVGDPTVGAANKERLRTLEDTESDQSTKLLLKFSLYLSTHDPTWRDSLLAEGDRLLGLRSKETDAALATFSQIGRSPRWPVTDGPTIDKLLMDKGTAQSPRVGYALLTLADRYRSFREKATALERSSEATQFFLVAGFLQAQALRAGDESNTSACDALAGMAPPMALDAAARLALTRSDALPQETRKSIDSCLGRLLTGNDFVKDSFKFSSSARPFPAEAQRWLGEQVAVLAALRKSANAEARLQSHVSLLAR